MARNTIEVKLVGDSSDLERALSRAGKSTQSNMQKIGKAAKIGAFALGSVLAGAAVVGFKELMEGQKVAAQTAAALKSTGQVAGVTAKDIEDLAGRLSALTGIDDELIQSSENVLLTFTSIRNEVEKDRFTFDQATNAALDLSVAMGKDLNSATVMVGKALNDPIRGLTALRKVGVQFTADQEKQIKALVASGKTYKAQQLILAELNREFGGLALAAGETLPGQLNKLKNSFEETAGALMQSLLPAITAILNKLLVFGQYLKDNPAQAKAVVVGLIAITAALVAATVAQAAMNLAVLANPYVAAAVAIVAFVAITVALIKKTDLFRQAWEKLGGPIRAFGSLVQTVVRAAIRAFDAMRDAFEKVKKTASTVLGALRIAFFGVLGPIQLTIAAVQRLIGWISRIPSPGDIVGGIAGAVGSVIPGGATGGHITSGGLMRVHRGEDLVPARITRNAGTGSSGGGGPMQLALVAVGPDIMRQLRELDRQTKMKGGLGFA